MYVQTGDMGNNCSETQVTVFGMMLPNGGITMPWKESTLMSQRLEFIRLAKTGVISMVQVCKRFEISTKTGTNG